MHEPKLGVWDFVAVAGYFAAVIGVGIFAMCRNNRSTVSGYFLAGRFMTWLPVGASLFASNIGSEHFIGLAGSGAASGVAVGAFELNACILLQLLGWVFLPVYIASGVCTLPEYMKKRFGGRRIRIYLATLSLTLYIFTKISVNLYSGALFIQQALYWNVYVSVALLLSATAITTVTGGLAAVIYTDTLQMFVMVIGALILMFISFVHVGGYEQLYHRYLTAVPNTTLANSNDTCGYPRDDAWIMLRDAVSSDMPWPAFLLGQTPASIWYWCTDQMMVQRTLAARSISHAQGGTLFAGYLKLLPIFLLVIPGMISRVLFTDEVACSDPAVCFEVCQNKHGCSNIAYPKLVLELMPSGLKGLMLSVMLAALMSDLTSIFNSASTLFTIDIYQYFRVKTSNRELMIVGRIFVCVMVVVGILWIPVIQGMQGAQLFFYIQAISAYLSPPIASVYLLAVLWTCANERGAFCGLMVGLTVGVARMVMDFVYPEPGCGEVDDRPLIVSRIHYMYFALLLFALTGITVIIISLASKRPGPSKTTRTTFWTRHDRSVNYDDGTMKTGAGEVAEAVLSSSGGKRLELTMLVAPAANSSHHAGSDDGSADRHPSGNGLKPETTVAVVSFDKNVDHMSHGVTWKWDYVRRFFYWFCGLDSSATTTPKHVSRLRDMTSLDQTPRARAVLYTALTVLITLDIFLYIFFSSGSDFGLLRNNAFEILPANTTTISLPGNHLTVPLNHTQYTS